MTALTWTPENPNYMPVNNFRFILHRCPHVSFFCQKANIPGLSLPLAPTQNPLVMTPHPGDHIAYDEFKITFGVDEKMENWLEIHNWLRALGFPRSTDEFAAIATPELETVRKGELSDATLLIYDASKVAKFQVDFIDIAPTGLTGIDLSSVETDSKYAYVTATFLFTLYEIGPASV